MCLLGCDGRRVPLAGKVWGTRLPGYFLLATMANEKSLGEVEIENQLNV